MKSLFPNFFRRDFSLFPVKISISILVDPEQVHWFPTSEKQNKKKSHHLFFSPFSPNIFHYPFSFLFHFSSFNSFFSPYFLIFFNISHFLTFFLASFFPNSRKKFPGGKSLGGTPAPRACYATDFRGKISMIFFSPPPFSDLQNFKSPPFYIRPPLQVFVNSP